MPSKAYWFDRPEPALDETQRQTAVDQTWPRIRSRREALQTVVETAARTFKTPIAAVAIIDRDHQRLAAKTGLQKDETNREVAFCAHAIRRPGETMVVEDASADPRFADNPLVTGDPHIRFYAGKPLVTRDGFSIGTLCVIDTEPREAPDNLFELTILAREVEKIMESNIG